MPTHFDGIKDAQTLAEAIVNTIHEPLLVLDAGLRVLSASRFFYAAFKVDPQQTIGCLLYDLGDGQWDIPALRELLETIIPQRTAMDGFEVDHDFPGLGRRVMLLNARKVLYETSTDTTILLAFTDITARRAVELEQEDLLETTRELLRQKQLLFQEMEHRVANSLQIIASILMLKARAVASDESRQHLKDAHQRVMSVAAVQSHLNTHGEIEDIEIGGYLTKLCASLAASMIGDDQTIKLKVIADEARIGSAQAVSVGLIVTELVINAVKYAFPVNRPDAEVLVTYANEGEGWALIVADNGIGISPADGPDADGGLGTVIVASLVKQLGAELVMTNLSGVSVAIRGPRIASRIMPAA
ncbi:MAG: histidine kinase dimerization/phosphoacceptor domain -containing protein [Caulobacter sp.]|nr:histidine kinase dimerization/phosphoacceptor domain -containing protein [Caulobacter sp.]